MKRHQKMVAISMRLPKSLLEDLKLLAVIKGVPYQRMVREQLAAYLDERRKT